VGHPIWVAVWDFFVHFFLTCSNSFLFLFLFLPLLFLLAKVTSRKYWFCRVSSSAVHTILPLVPLTPSIVVNFIPRTCVRNHRFLNETLVTFRSKAMVLFSCVFATVVFVYYYVVAQHITTLVCTLCRCRCLCLCHSLSLSLSLICLFHGLSHHIVTHLWCVKMSVDGQAHGCAFVLGILISLGIRFTGFCTPPPLSLFVEVHMHARWHVVTFATGLSHVYRLECGLPINTGLGQHPLLLICILHNHDFKSRQQFTRRQDGTFVQS
jgi:hypothetical protein